MEGKVKVKALHVEINALPHQWNFTNLLNKYGRSDKGFPGGRKMRLFPVKNNTKSDYSKKINKSRHPPKILPGNIPIYKERGTRLPLDDDKQREINSIS